MPLNKIPIKDIIYSFLFENVKQWKKIKCHFKVKLMFIFVSWYYCQIKMMEKQW